MRRTFQERVLVPVRARQRRRRWGVLLVSYALVGMVVSGGDLWRTMHHPTPASVLPADPQTWSYVTRDGIPATLVLNGETWSLAPAGSFQDPRWLAATFCQDKTIYYLPMTTPREVWREDVMHELFHAGACAHGGATWWNSVKDDPIEHPGIYHLGTFTAQLLHDNPELMAWVAR